MLQTIQRPPTPAERSILELHQLHARQKLKEGFHWKNGLLTGGFFIATLIAFYCVGGHWFLFFLGIILGLVLYGQIRGYFSDRKRYQKRLQQVSELLSTNTLSVMECKGSSILHLQSYSDEGCLFLIEIEEGRLLSFHRGFEGDEIFAPNDHIRFYADTELRFILGTGFERLGEPIAPLIISGELKLEVSEVLQWPEHLAVVETSIEEVLDQCKRKLQEKVEGG
ncbi:MAG: hypothetical protein AAFY48_15455 [Bacteroidota bacterium]